MSALDDIYRLPTPPPDPWSDADSIDDPPAKSIRRQAYRPFPADTFPPAIARFIGEASAALGCDAAYIAVPLLAALSAAIGNSRTLRLKAGWDEPATIWTALVAASGTLKSPAIKLALRSIVRRQTQLWSAHAAAEQHKSALKEWKAIPKEERGDEPEEPAPLEHLYCNDVTVEGLAMRIGSRGLLVAVDELAGWFKSWNQYKSKGGGDCESYLSFYDAAAAKIDRKTAIPPTIFIPRAFVAVAGGILPGVLRRLLNDGHFDSGLAARFMFAHPPESVVRWRDDTVSADALAGVDAVFDRLWAMAMRAGDDGSAEPVSLSLTAAAREHFARYVDRNGEEYAALSDDNLKAAWAKLRGAAARLALILHCASAASGERMNADAVDEMSMRAGIRLADWFGGEAIRLYAELGESAEHRQRRELADLIRDKMGGQATVNDLRRRLRRYRDDPALARADLDALAEAGFGEWKFPAPGPHGGKPTETFFIRVYDDNVYDTPVFMPASGGIVDVDVVEGIEKFGDGRIGGGR